MAQDEVGLSGGGSTAVHRRGDLVLRQRRPWSATVMRLLKHLEEGGFTAAPRPRESGFAPDGREALSFFAGEPAPVCWSAGAAYRVGVILRELHTATADFVISDPTWMPWWGRDVPTQDLLVGHCDAAPWNFLAAVDGLPVALLDWDTAGAGRPGVGSGPDGVAECTAPRRRCR
ncbi:MAG: aminoglycoside phosphotransferase family protein [Actinomycetota bacterium]|nr:aminoglycoside phosphotransferase family protein [Actinomycetota bacterium]